MTALKLIYDKLMAGESFGKITRHQDGGTMFWDALYYDGNYLCCRGYGLKFDSCKASVENLKWIIKNMFMISPEQFLYDYTTYNQWKMINDCYEVA